jgi:hypothetical protein
VLQEGAKSAHIQHILKCWRELKELGLLNTLEKGYLQVCIEHMQ